MYLRLQKVAREAETGGFQGQAGVPWESLSQN